MKTLKKNLHDEFLKAQEGIKAFLRNSLHQVYNEIFMQTYYNIQACMK